MLSAKKVPFWDLRVTNPDIKRELLGAVDQVLSHGRLVLGPEIEEFEKRTAEYCQTQHAVGVNSGTDAVFLALKALGIGKGDEVILPALSWIASANAIALTGATPIFADIGDDLNIDPRSVESLVTPRTKVILPVHFMGLICDMPALQKIATQHGLTIVEDAAQAFGATRFGKRAGSFGRLSAFSMNPMKVFGALGEAGAVTTNDAELKERLIALRYNGMVDKIECRYQSLNGRLDTIQAAMLLVRFKYLEGVISRRREIAKKYETALAKKVKVVRVPEGAFHVYYGYTVLSDRRSAFIEHLSSMGIETKIQHHPLMPDQPAYASHRTNAYPNASRIVEQIVNIPCHENMSDAEVDRVIEGVLAFS